MEDEIDLKNILKSFWDRKIGIILIVLVAIAVGFIYTSYFIDPVYSATATAILTNNSSSEEGGESVTQSELTLNNQLLGTYREIARSDAVVSTVISNLGLTNITDAALKGQIAVTSSLNTQVIEITVTNSEPNLAAKIANEIRKVFAEKVKEIYKIDNIQPLDDAKIPTAASNINHTKDIIIFAAGGLVLAVIYVIIANILDNTVKSSKDIENATGLDVIAEIPLYEVDKRRRK